MKPPSTVDASEIRRLLVEVGSSQYPIIYKVLYIPGGAGSLPSTVDLPYSLKVHLG